MVAPYLDFFATGAHVGQDGIDADLVDYTQTSVGQTQGDPAVFRFNKNTTVLQVRQETTFGFVVCVGNIVADHRLLPSNLANTCHNALLKRHSTIGKTRVYPKTSAFSMTCEKQLCLAYIKIFNNCEFARKPLSP